MDSEISPSSIPIQALDSQPGEGSPSSSSIDNPNPISAPQQVNPNHLPEWSGTGDDDPHKFVWNIQLATALEYFLPKREVKHHSKSFCCFGCKPKPSVLKQGLAQIYRLMKLRLDLENPIHSAILSKSIYLVSGKTLAEVSVHRPVNGFTRGDRFSAPLDSSLEQAGVIPNLLFILFLSETCKAEFERMLSCLDSSPNGQIPLLTFLIYINGLFWSKLNNFPAQSSSDKPVQAVFQITGECFKAWVNQYKETEINWDSEEEVSVFLKHHIQQLRQTKRLTANS